MRYIKKIMILIIFFLCFSCSSQKIDNTTMVESVSVQELDSVNYFDDKQKASNDLINKYQMKMVNFKLMANNDISNCYPIDGINAQEYSVVNKDNFSNSKIYKYHIELYKMANKKCSKVNSLNNYQAIKVLGFNKKGYLLLKKMEEKESYDIYQVSDNKFKLMYSSKDVINNMFVLNNKVFFQYANSLKLIASDHKIYEVKNDNEDKIYSLSGDGTYLYLMFIRKDNTLYVNKYRVVNKRIANLKDMILIDSIELNFDNVSNKLVKAQVTNNNKSLVVYDNRMVCQSDYKSCSYLKLDDEKIVDVMNGYVLYNSDKTYISNYYANNMQALSSLVINDAKIYNNQLYLKVFFSGKTNNYSYLVSDFNITK